MNPNWSTLRSDCLSVHGCSPWAVSSSRNKREQRKLEKKQQDIDQVIGAAEKVLIDTPNIDPQAMIGPILAILLPWMLPILRSFLISAFQKMVLDWILNRLQKGSP